MGNVGDLRSKDTVILAMPHLRQHVCRSISCGHLLIVDVSELSAAML